MLTRRREIGNPVVIISYCTILTSNTECIHVFAFSMSNLARFSIKPVDLHTIMATMHTKDYYVVRIRLK
jgi:hypothetical protein